MSAHDTCFISAEIVDHFFAIIDIYEKYSYRKAEISYGLIL